MRKILEYNIHDILKFKIICEKKHISIRNVDLPFSFFEVEEIDEAEIILNIGKFKPSNNNCYVVEHKYYIKENYFYCKDAGGRARWEMEIFGFEHGDTIVNFNGSILGPENTLIPNLLPQDNILEPICGYKLCKKGYFLIHSAGVSKNNRATLLAGRGGAFKSRLAIDFIRNEFDCLGDDLVIIHKDKVLSFPINFVIFSYKIKNFPPKNFHFLNKIHLARYLWKNSDQMNNIPITDSSVLKALLFVVKTNKQSVDKRELGQKEAIRKLITNNIVEMNTTRIPSIIGQGRYLRYMLAYSFVFPESRVATYWNDLKDGLEKILKNVPIYEVEISESYSSGTFSQVYEFIGGII